MGLPLKWKSLCCHVLRGLEAFVSLFICDSLTVGLVYCVVLCGGWWTDKLLALYLTAQLVRKVIWGHSATHHCGRQMVPWCVFVSFDTTCVSCIIALSLPLQSTLFLSTLVSRLVVLLSSVYSRSIAHVCLTSHTFLLLCLLRLWWMAFTGLIALHSSPLLTDLTNTPPPPPPLSLDL